MIHMAFFLLGIMADFDGFRDGGFPLRDDHIVFHIASTVRKTMLEHTTPPVIGWRSVVFFLWLVTRGAYGRYSYG